MARALQDSLDMAYSNTAFASAAAAGMTREELDLAFARQLQEEEYRDGNERRQGMAAAGGNDSNGQRLEL